VTAAVGLLLGAALLEPVPPDLRAQLRAEAALSEAELQQVAAGVVVAKVLDSADRAEIVSFAALRVRTSTDRFLGCMRDVRCLKANEDVLEVGRFQNSPSPGDLAGLSLDARDRDYLSRCAVSRCDVRLAADAIERFRTGIDWPPSNPESVAELFRNTLANLAAAYVLRGNKALPIYQDNPRPASVGASTSELLGRRWFVLEGCPELLGHLRDFPGSPLATGEDFLYWYKERFWRKTVVNLNHVTIYQKDDDRRVYVASKQLYSTHYHESAIEVLVFSSDRGDTSGTLVFLSRARADIRPTGFNWLERALIRRLVRGRLENQFRLLRGRLEGSRATSR
jgi:hypothetical protein